jgi:hypothetical protein
MTHNRCPKCGSDQVLNDECLKCGVLVSKAQHLTSSTGMKPISYVSPETTTGVVSEQPASAPVPAWRPPVQDHVISMPVKSQKGVMERRLLLLIIVVLLIGGGYQFYRFLVHQTSAYSGYYRNDVYYFTMNLPEKGWSHYRVGDLKDPEFKDAHDAFYRGKDPDDPEIKMLIWSEGVGRKKVPKRFDEETAGKMLDSIEREIVQRMEDAGLKCEITQSSKTLIGGNDGFVVHANVTKGELFMKTTIYCGFAESRAYTIQFVGNDQKMTDFQQELDEIMSSFEYDVSLF